MSGTCLDLYVDLEVAIQEAEVEENSILLPLSNDKSWKRVVYSKGVSSGCITLAIVVLIYYYRCEEESLK